MGSIFPFHHLNWLYLLHNSSFFLCIPLRYQATSNIWIFQSTFFWLPRSPWNSTNILCQTMSSGFSFENYSLVVNSPSCRAEQFTLCQAVIFHFSPFSGENWGHWLMLVLKQLFMPQPLNIPSCGKNCEGGLRVHFQSPFLIASFLPLVFISHLPAFLHVSRQLPRTLLCGRTAPFTLLFTPWVFRLHTSVKNISVSCLHTFIFRHQWLKIS